MTEEPVEVHRDLCRDCQACQLACSLYHEGQCHLGLARLQVGKDMARSTFDRLRGTPVRGVQGRYELAHTGAE